MIDLPPVREEMKSSYVVGFSNLPPPNPTTTTLIQHF